MSYEDLMIAHVLPLLACRRVEAGKYNVIRFAGTCFTFGEGTVVTAHHCVAEPLDPGYVYCAVLRTRGWDTQEGVYDNAYEIEDLSQVPRNLDLALGRVGFKLDQRLTLAEDPLQWGEDVVSCGYPLPVTQPELLPAGVVANLNARLLRGYVTRNILPDDPSSYRPARSVELDMPAPPGLSGAPLFRPHPFEVVGVVTSEPAYPSSRTQPGTANPGAEFYRFALAHRLQTLREASGPATDGKPLAEYLLRSEA